MAAQEALDTLNKVTREVERKGAGVVMWCSGVTVMCLSLQNNLTELKSFGSPPDAVVNVTAAVMILTAPGGKIPKDKSWKAAKIMMGKVDTFLDSLKKFDKEHIPEACLKAFKYAVGRGSAASPPGAAAGRSSKGWPQSREPCHLCPPLEGSWDRQTYNCSFKPQLPPHTANNLNRGQPRATGPGRGQPFPKSGWPHTTPHTHT